MHTKTISQSQKPPAEPVLSVARIAVYMHHTIYALTLALLLFAMDGPLYGSNQALEQFQEEYDAASRQLELSYSSVMLSGSLSRSDGKGNPFYEGDFEVFRSGDSLRLDIRVTESGQDKLPVGTQTTRAGENAKAFAVTKSSPVGEYAITTFGPDETFWERTRISCFPAFAPYAIPNLQNPLREYILDANYMELVSARSVDFEGSESVKVEARRRHPDGKFAADVFYFQPATWAIMGWDVDTSTLETVTSLHGRITYENAHDAIRVASVVTWRENERGAKTDHFVYDIDSISFLPLADRVFTLASLGLEEPALTSDRRQGFNWIVLNVVIVVLLAIALYFRHRFLRVNA